MPPVPTARTLRQVPDRDEPARLPDNVPGYRIERLLGAGGMGTVYLAWDEALNRRVALKFVATEIARDPGLARRFADESRLAASIDHAHILPIYEARTDGERSFIAMRFVDGPTLGDLIRGGSPLHPGRVLELLSGVAEALDVAHRRGLIHRDVKPAKGAS